MLQVKNLVKRYATKGETVTALAGVSVDFPERGMVFLLGKSGSGKSTLLNVAGGLDSPDGGEVVVKGRSSADFKKSDFDSYRNTYVGFIFQEYNILNELTVAENVALAVELQGKPRDDALVEKLLEQVDLKGYGDRRPNTLSGGQKQRVAIARALVKEPEIIMADEPTGALDSATGKQVMDTLKKLSAEKLVVVVSHDRDFAERYADRIIELKDGKIVSDLSRGEEETFAGNLIEEENALTVVCGADLDGEEEKRVLAFLKSRKGSLVISAAEGKVEVPPKAVFRKTELSPQPREEEGGGFLRSRFPMRYALKMGISGLKFKPLRLAFTTLLATVAFLVFGVFSTLLTYDSLKLSANTLADSSFSTGVIFKKGVVHSENQNGPFTRNFPVNLTQYLHFDGRDVALLQSEHPEMEFVPVFDFDLAPLSVANSQTNLADGEAYSASFYYGQTRFFNGFAFASDVREKTDFRLTAGRWPQEVEGTVCEIVISQAALENFEYYGYRASAEDRPVAIGSFADLEGKSITAVAGAYRFYLKVVGVVDTEEDFSDYEYLKTAEQASDAETSELYEHYRYSFAAIGIVADNFHEAFADFDLAPSNYRSAVRDLYRNGVRNTTSYEEHPEEGILYAGLYTSLRKNRAERCKTVMSYHRAVDETRDVYYATPYSFTSGIAEGDGVLSDVAAVVGPTAGGLAVFAALLLFNFISTSVNAKKKDIGILRAVGARGSDVFKIFVVEGLAITLLSFALGCFGALAACAIANAVVVQKGILEFAFFLFDWPNALMVLAVALATAALGTTVPVALNARKKPVEAIRAI